MRQAKHRAVSKGEYSDCPAEALCRETHVAPPPQQRVFWMHPMLSSRADPCRATTTNRKAQHASQRGGFPGKASTEHPSAQEAWPMSGLLYSPCHIHALQLRVSDWLAGLCCSSMKTLHFCLSTDTAVPFQKPGCQTLCHAT